MERSLFLTYSSIHIYLAGSIFYYGDVLRNKEWANRIRIAFPGISLYSPIENTDINGTEGKKKFAGARQIARADNARLDHTNILIVCLDGDVIPAGSACEIGRMSKIIEDQGGLIVGICTDNRQCYLTHSTAKDSGGAAELGEQQYSYQNLYVTGVIKESGGTIVSSIEDAIEQIKKWIRHNSLISEERIEELSKDGNNKD